MSIIHFVMEDESEGVVKVKFTASEPMPEAPEDMSLAQMVAAELSNWTESFFLIKDGRISLDILRTKYGTGSDFNAVTADTSEILSV